MHASVRVHARTKARTDVTRVKNARRFLTRRTEIAVLYRSRSLGRLRERAFKLVAWTPLAKNDTRGIAENARFFRTLKAGLRQISGA